MALRKFATLEVLDAWRQGGAEVPEAFASRRITRTAHRVAFDYQPRDGYLYVRSRMISSRTNDNHDTFPAGEIEKGYKTFLGKPVFVNHHNSNHRRARGVIVAVALHRDRNPDGSPDTWVEGLMEVDAVKFPKLAKAIIARRVNRTSMGVDVDWSTCSACGNKATSPAEYCKHLPAMKGKKIRQRNKVTGKIEEKLIHEVCAGLSFFENSLLVEDPADPTAFLIGDVDTRGLSRKTAVSRDMTYGGTHCVVCHEPVRINMRKQEINGGWHHHDGMKRDHPAISADPEGVIASIPGQEAQRDQAQQAMRDYLHGQFEQLSGRPLPRKPRGDEGQMPLDPFTAAPKRKGGDHPWFHEHPVSKDHIVAAYHDTTDDEKALGDRWYSDAHHIAKAIGRGDAALGAGLLSAYSPQTAWPVNMFNASRAAQGDPPGPGSGAMGIHQKAAMRILAGEHHSKVLKAPKTAAFAHLIEHGGDSADDEKHGRSRVVIDRHALSVAAGRRLSKDEGGKAPLGQHQHYEHVEQLYRDAAADLSKATGKKISPHQVQAATWLRQIRKNTEEDASGAKGSGGKGRVRMQDNSRTRWVEHHRHHHPGAIPEENMHHHGAYEAPNCGVCGTPLNHSRYDENDDWITDPRPGARASLRYPFMCRSCAWKYVPEDMEMPVSKRDKERFQEGGHLRSFTPADEVQAHMGSRLAYGETRVPPQVDTLRMDECPVCGENNVWSGSRCPVCGFVVPPSVFRDPDTDKAREVREQLDGSGQVDLPPDAPMAQGPDGEIPGQGQQIGSGDDADDQLVHPDQIAPDGVPVVQGEGGPVPAADTDGQPPDPGEAENEEEEAGEEEAEDEGLLPPEPEGEPGDPGLNTGEDLECPACGTTFETDGAAQPGVPCPACGMASLHPIDEDLESEAPGGPQKEQEDPSDPGEEPEDEEDEEDEDKDMPESKTAAAVQQAQARRIAELSARNAVLEAQLSFLASVAGVDREFRAIETETMRRHADMMNPASPVPDPPEAPAPETTEQALMPASQDNASRPGTSPGANAHVPAAQTTTAITPGVEMQTPPASNLIDVTAPTQGTNPAQDGGVPVEQRRIETDVRIDPDPLKAHGPGIGGQGDNGAAFPWLLNGPGQQGGQPGQQRAASLSEADASRRTFASIRLAKMRITAGMAQGDELAVAARIEKDASLPTEMIEHEISVLGAVPMPAHRGEPVRPVQRTAARQAPSLASVGASYAPAGAGYGDYGDDGSDIFL